MTERGKEHQTHCTQKARVDVGSVFHELTRSICPRCLDPIDAQVLLKSGRVIMRKRCPTHGWFESLISSDSQMYLDSLRYNKPGTMPQGFSTEVVDGRPLDCGLCPEHKKHVFMIVVQGFADAYTMDLKTLMKCCIGELIPDGRIIPFCAYNTVGYREKVRAALTAGKMQ